MYAIEFEADIEEGVLHIPENYRSPGKVHAKVIILTQVEQRERHFNPQEFYGVAHESKEEIDTYLAKTRNEWS
ncbi:MAG TPA: hypothetical protein VF268_03680 [Gammaproteobacteria bacterium]